MHRQCLGIGLLALILGACSNPPIPFTSFRQEVFETTAITTSQSKVLRLANPHPDEAQHIPVVAFDAGGNVGGHFQIKSVIVGGRDVGTKDIVVPGGSDVEIQVVYAPKTLETTRAEYGGWVTGAPTRYEPKPPKSILTSLVASRWLLSAESKLQSPAPVTSDERPATAVPEAIHRALMILTFDHPDEGVTQIELVGRAVAGPNGEITAVGGGVATKPGECAPGGMTACFSGQLGIELPGLMKAGPVYADLSGPMAVTIDGSSAQLDMNTFPPAVFVVRGNGPGEPLEGQPVSAISIVISGSPDIVANGSFDGSSLQLSEVGFRIRIYLSEVTLEEAETSVATADFLVNGLTLTTTMPLADGKATFKIETTLAQNPSGNPLVDPLLSNAAVTVTMDGNLQVP